MFGIVGGHHPPTNKLKKIFSKNIWILIFTILTLHHQVNNNLKHFKKMRTVPTIITKEEYENAFFAVTRSNADLFILWNNGKNILWLGRNEQNWKDFNPKTNSDCEVSVEDLTDENGSIVEEECYICPVTAFSCNTLDLDLLEEGKISWY